MSVVVESRLVTSLEQLDQVVQIVQLVQVVLLAILIQLVQVVQLTIDVESVTVVENTLLVGPGELVLALRCHAKLVSGMDAMGRV